MIKFSPDLERAFKAADEELKAVLDKGRELLKNFPTLDLRARK